MHLFPRPAVQFLLAPDILSMRSLLRFRATTAQPRTASTPLAFATDRSRRDIRVMSGIAARARVAGARRVTGGDVPSARARRVSADVAPLVNRGHVARLNPVLLRWPRRSTRHPGAGVALLAPTRASSGGDVVIYSFGDEGGTRVTDEGAAGRASQPSRRATRDSGTNPRVVLA